MLLFVIPVCTGITGSPALLGFVKTIQRSIEGSSSHLWQAEETTAGWRVLCIRLPHGFGFKYQVRLISNITQDFKAQKVQTHFCYFSLNLPISSDKRCSIMWTLCDLETIFISMINWKNMPPWWPNYYNCIWDTHYKAPYYLFKNIPESSQVHWMEKLLTYMMWSIVACKRCQIPLAYLCRCNTLNCAVFLTRSCVFVLASYRSLYICPVS